jgi:putative tricarboxylic transport membrane protein
MASSGDGAGGGVPAVPVAAVFCALLALVFGLGAFRLGFWQEGVPGPGLLPFITSLALLPIALRLLLRPRSVPEAGPLRAMPLLALAVLAVYGAVVARLGFVGPSLVLLAVWRRAFHGGSWRVAAVTSLALVIGAVLLFRTLLGVPLPLWPGSLE